MATTTPRIGLTKPDGTDLVDIAVLNTNFDKIDSNIASTKIQATKPTTANAGDLWWDSDTGTLYVYYVGASSSSWVAATSDPINIGVVANQTERDAQYPTPAQGMSVWRQDLGAQETYYGLYNASTNPGGRSAAGWYQEAIGRVLQVKSLAVSTQTTNTSAAFANTALSLSITPKFANSKIIINVNTNVLITASGVDWYGTIFRGGVGGTNLPGSTAALLWANSARTNDLSTQFVSFWDFPNTTSPVTYTFSAYASSGTLITPYGGTIANIQIIEVAG